MRRVVIAGVSTRAAAESGARAGFEITAIDAFADADQHPSVRAVSIPRPFTASAAAGAASRVDSAAAVYLSNFENYPEAVCALAAGRVLWGNTPDVLRRVRDPERLAQSLAVRGFFTPGVQLKPDTCGDRIGPGKAADGDWLVKPLASGGGHAVRRWHRGEPVPDGCYLQELISGKPCSAAFVAAGGRAVLLGIFRQLIGERAFGAAGYRYCGNILMHGADRDFRHAVAALSRAVSEQFGLVGVNGIDFIARDRQPYVIEVNPRWTGSMELVERACAVSVFGLHAAACADAALPEVDVVEMGRNAGAIGKAIVFSRHTVTIGDTRAWIDDPAVRDVPHHGEQIRAGQPVCTVFATGSSEQECFASLVRRAEGVYTELAAWKSDRDRSTEASRPSYLE